MLLRGDSGGCERLVGPIENSTRQRIGLFRRIESRQRSLKEQLVARRILDAELEKGPDPSLEGVGARRGVENRVPTVHLLIALSEHGLEHGILRVEIRVEGGWLHPNGRRDASERHAGQSLGSRQ